MKVNQSPVATPAHHESQSSNEQTARFADNLIRRLTDSSDSFKGAGKTTFGQINQMNRALEGIRKEIGNDASQLLRTHLDQLNEHIALSNAEDRAAVTTILAEGLSEYVSPFDFSQNLHPTSLELQRGMAKFRDQWKTSHYRAVQMLQGVTGKKDKFDKAIDDIIANHCQNREELAQAVAKLFAQHGDKVFAATTSKGEEISSKFLAIAALAIALNPQQRIAGLENGNAILVDDDGRSLSTSTSCPEPSPRHLSDPTVSISLPLAVDVEQAHNQSRPSLTVTYDSAVQPQDLAARFHALMEMRAKGLVQESASQSPPTFRGSSVVLGKTPQETLIE